MCRGRHSAGTFAARDKVYSLFLPSAKKLQGWKQRYMVNSSSYKLDIPPRHTPQTYPLQYLWDAGHINDTFVPPSCLLLAGTQLLQVQLVAAHFGLLPAAKGGSLWHVPLFFPWPCVRLLHHVQTPKWCQDQPVSFQEVINKNRKMMFILYLAQTLEIPEIPLQISTGEVLPPGLQEAQGQLHLRLLQRSLKVTRGRGGPGRYMKTYSYDLWIMWDLYGFI